MSAIKCAFKGCLKERLRKIPFCFYHQDHKICEECNEIILDYYIHCKNCMKHHNPEQSNFCNKCYENNILCVICSECINPLEQVHCKGCEKHCHFIELSLSNCCIKMCINCKHENVFDPVVSSDVLKILEILENGK